MSIERIFGTGSPKIFHDNVEYIIDYATVEYNVIDPNIIFQTSIITGRNHIKNKYNHTSLRLFVHLFLYDTEYKNKYIFYRDTLRGKTCNLATHENADYITDVWNERVIFFIDQVTEYFISEDKLIIELNLSSLTSTRYLPVTVDGYGYRYGFAYGLAL